MELKVVERERCFVDGLRSRLQDILQQLRHEESQILSALAPPLPAPEPNPTRDVGQTNGMDNSHAPPSPRTPPLRPYLELDPLKLSGNPLLPHWRLESEDMSSPQPDDCSDSATDGPGLSSASCAATVARHRQQGMVQQSDPSGRQPVDSHDLEQVPDPDASSSGSMDLQEAPRGMPPVWSPEVDPNPVEKSHVPSAQLKPDRLSLLPELPPCSQPSSSSRAGEAGTAPLAAEVRIHDHSLGRYSEFASFSSAWQSPTHLEETPSPSSTASTESTEEAPAKLRKCIATLRHRLRKPWTTSSLHGDTGYLELALRLENLQTDACSPAPSPRKRCRLIRLDRLDSPGEVPRIDGGAAARL